jgi:predicted nucleic acid-binding protein
MLLFDTSVLIELEVELSEKRVGPVRSYLGSHRASDLACSTVTIGELAAGSNEASVRVFLRKLKKIPISEAIAYRAAELDRAQSRKGMRLGKNDTWIAATALIYSATLVHGHAGFLRVDGLKQVSPK